MSQDTIPERFRQRIQKAREQQLSELDLSSYWDDSKDQYQELTRIPDKVFELTHLKKLDLSNNNIQHIPSQISRLTNLESLDLIGNYEFTDIPEELRGFLRSVLLKLTWQVYTPLPEWFSQIDQLGLHLIESKEWERIESRETIPDTIVKLKNLFWLRISIKFSEDWLPWLQTLNELELYLYNNQLTTFPESITKLSNLTELDLSENQLTTLPESITKLSNLTRLDLGYNQLNTLPESITKLSNLTTLYLSGNPLEKPPLEIANKGIEAIKEYFRQLQEEGIDYIYEAKLLIVGEGGAGKTTLAKKIEDSNYQVDSNEKSTEGIDITKWSFPFFDKKQKEREFKVNIWDFGGQEIYHATHQFFLTKRSLYALVADTRKDDTDFYYWLNVVELLSENSPLLIVKNEKQDRKREINERALRGQFTNLKETLATNLKTNRGLKEIVTNIQDYIKKLPHIGQALPKTWVDVRKSLEEDKRNHIYLQEYLDICEANGFKKLEDKLQLSGYLHDLGVCLHFQDEENSLLYKTVILKPEWGTDAVYEVLDNKQVINNQGHFTRNDLKNIWHEEKYALMRGELLELMKKFQLCYEIPDSKDSFIAPQLLSDNQPDYNWDESNNLILRYTYPAFMPKGIISRFIVIMHQYIHSANHNQCVWKSGAVLKQNNTLAEVIEYYGKREIIIRVLGNDKRGFMTIVANEIDKINKSYPRLNYQKLTPCNCPICKNNQNPYTYQFNELVERLANNKLTIECGKSPYHEVQVLDLIDHSIDIQKLISQAQQDNNRDANFQGDAKQLIIQLFGDFMQGNKNIKQTNLGNGDNVAGNKNIDQSRNVNISGNAQVTASGAGAFNLGDISGTVANTINQLPTSPNPNQPGIKELLIRLGEAISTSEDLDDKRKAKAFKQIEALATAAQNPNDEDMKDSAEDATTILEKIVSKLPAAAALVTICQEV
ncbi:MAG: COR domain-containing protein, partial [Xenococcaceae cyanobacterium MO_188.B29]|nr:COR domain-containing protein [Xenococcaceae cyanobacterium MO_188.B29]